MNIPDFELIAQMLDDAALGADMEQGIFAAESIRAQRYALHNWIRSEASAPTSAQAGDAALSRSQDGVEPVTDYAWPEILRKRDRGDLVAHTIPDETMCRWANALNTVLANAKDQLAASATPTAGQGGDESVAWTDKERAAIADMMATQEFSYAVLMRQAVRLYQHDLMRRKDGETCTWSGDEQRAREFAGISTPAPAAPVSERTAVSALVSAAKEIDRQAWGHGTATITASQIKALGFARESVEQALPQQRGEVAAWQMRSRYWDGAPWSEWRTSPSNEAREADWIPYKDSEWLRETRELFTTPQPSAEGLRELVQRWRANGSPYVSACAAELESLLAGGVDHG